MDLQTALYMFQGTIQSILFEQSVKSRIKSRLLLVDNHLQRSIGSTLGNVFCHFVSLALPNTSIYHKTV